MLYSFIKIPARFAIRIYCRSILVNNRNILRQGGPLLIAANHPNSFLDAIIFATLFKKPVYSLVRGDTFKNKFLASLLTSLNMLPVYRISEGAQNLNQNYETFEKCKEIFRSNGIVLIFSEGRCINEWKLRPLKKGTARLAVSSWQDGIELKVLPAGINYQSFTSFGKNVKINFGTMLSRYDVTSTNGYGNPLNEFNRLLKNELHSLVIEIDSNDKQQIHDRFTVQLNLAKRIALILPAVAGFIIHAPLYMPLQKLAKAKAGQNDHYDSVLTGLLFFLYPVYLLLVALLLNRLAGEYWWIIIFIFPFCAWSYVQIKKQF